MRVEVKQRAAQTTPSPPAEQFGYDWSTPFDSNDQKPLQQRIKATSSSWR